MDLRLLFLRYGWILVIILPILAYGTYQYQRYMSFIATPGEWLVYDESHITYYNTTGRSFFDYDNWEIINRTPNPYTKPDEYKELIKNKKGKEE